MRKDTTGKTKRIRLDRPGVLACGSYEHGKVYEVPSDDAVRLIETKGFIEVKTESEPGATSPHEED